MRYQLLTAWPIGQFCIEAGTTIDLNIPQQFWTDNAKLAYGRIPPPDAIALDRECRDFMKKAYAHAPWLSLKASLSEWFEQDQHWPVVHEAMKELSIGVIFTEEEKRAILDKYPEPPRRKPPQWRKQSIPPLRNDD